MAAYIDHVGYRVKDLGWYITFFEEVYAMPVERERTNADGTREVWLTGGLQLVEDPAYSCEDGRCHHLCLLVEDLEAVRAMALARGCTELPKHHWIKLPDGLQIEMFSAAPGAVDALKTMKKRG